MRLLKIRPAYSPTDAARWPLHKTLEKSPPFPTLPPVESRPRAADCCWPESNRRRWRRNRVPTSRPLRKPARRVYDMPTSTRTVFVIRIRDDGDGYWTRGVRRRRHCARLRHVGVRRDLAAEKKPPHPPLGNLATPRYISLVISTDGVVLGRRVQGVHSLPPHQKKLN